MIKHFISLSLALLAMIPFYGQPSPSPVCDISFMISGITLSGRDLTRAGFDVFDRPELEHIPIVPLILPSLSFKYNKKSPIPNTPLQFAYSSEYLATATHTGIVNTITLSFPPFLSVATGCKLQSAWNYGSYTSFLAVYNPEEKKYTHCTSLSELEYGFTGSVGLMIPLGVYMIRLNYTADYVGFTGAENGQPWNCGMDFNNVNGWKYKTSAIIGRRFDYTVLKMISLVFSAGSWYRDSYFNEEYRQYDPTFVTISITPMTQLSLSKRQMLMLSALINRERAFENDDFDSKELLLQNCIGGEWRLKAIMFVWRYSLSQRF